MLLGRPTFTFVTQALQPGDQFGSSLLGFDHIVDEPMFSCNVRIGKFLTVIADELLALLLLVVKMY